MATVVIHCPRCGAAVDAHVWVSVVHVWASTLTWEVLTDNPEHSCPDPNRDK